MGTKANRREARIAAAKARDWERFQAGTQDGETIAFLTQQKPDTLRKMIAHAEAIRDRPMALEREEALQVLGAASMVRKQAPLIQLAAD